ncbi:hypothetical protein MOUN0_G00518 [Monosporozyma unispora]
MVQINKSLLTAAAIAEGATAVTTLPVTDDKVQNIELVVYCKDIINNMDQYVDFREANPDQPYPTQLNQIVINAVIAGDGDDSWTSSLTGIDPATVEMMLTGVPWYSTRILPVLQDTLNSDNIAVVGINAEVAPASSAVVAVSTSAPAAPMSSAAADEPEPSAAPTSSAVQSSAVETSSAAQSSAAQSSAAQSSAAQSSAAQSSAAQSSAVQSSAVETSSAAQSSAAQSSAVQSSAVETSSAAQSSAAQSSAKKSSAKKSSAKKSSKSVAPVSSVASVKVSSSVNGTLVGKVTTKWNTVTSQYSNTTTITSCPPESATTVDITAKHTSEVTDTVCDEVCHSKKSAAAAASITTVTSKETSTVTQTICDETCQSKKSLAAKKASTSTVAQAVKSEVGITSSKPFIDQQTENAAAKAYAGIGAGVLAAAALLI